MGPGTGRTERLQRLWLEPVVNETREPLFGPRLRSALAREAVDRADAVLSSRSEARSFLSVKVLRVTETATAFVVGDLPRLYLVSGEVEARLTTLEGELLWKGLHIRAEREFSSGATVEATQSNKEAALELLSRDLSREILRRVSLAMAARLE